jgi:hypothetical protein
MQNISGEYDGFGRHCQGINMRETDTEPAFSASQWTELRQYSGVISLTLAAKLA